MSTATGPLQVWARPLASGAVAAALLNRSAGAANVTAAWAALGFPPSAALLVRDLWARQNLGTFKGAYTAVSVPSHGTAMLSFTLVK